MGFYAMDKVVSYTIKTLIYQKKPVSGFFSQSSEAYDAVNYSVLQTYWNIGKRTIEKEQKWSDESTVWERNYQCVI